MPRYPVQPADAEFTAEGGVAAVDRALTLLVVFKEGDEALSLTELSQRARLVRSTTLRLIASLVHFRFLQKMSDGRYMLGPAIARLQTIYASSFKLDSLVPAAMRKLVDATQESVSFHVKQGEHRLVLYRVNSPQALTDQSRAGDLLPLDRGAGGHVICAFEGAKGVRFDRIRRDWLLKMPVSDRTKDLASISAPVFSAGQQFVGALTLIMPAQRYSAKHEKTVFNVARDLTHSLGGSFAGDDE